MRWFQKIRFDSYLFLLFLVSRLVFLTTLPIFNDESIILNFSTNFLKSPEKWFTVMSDGKQPLFGISVALVQLFPIDPLIAGRLMMVAWSLVTFWATIKIAKTIGFSISLQIVTALFLIFCPYLLFYDRIVLPESPIVAISTLILWVSLLFQKQPTIAKGIAIGVLFALGWWYFSLILLFAPIVGLLYIIQLFRRRHERSTLILAGLAAIITFLFLILPVIAQPYYHELLKNDPQRVLSMTDIVSLPISRWTSNGHHIAEWIMGFATPILVLLALIGLITSNKNLQFATLVLWLCVPLLISLVMVKTMSARNLVIVMPAMILLSVYGFSYLTRVFHRGIIAALSIVPLVALSGMMIVSPSLYYQTLSYLPLAHADFAQYVEGSPSGYGVKEAADYLQGKSKNQPTLVYVRFDLGNPEDAMFVYLRSQKNLLVVPAYTRGDLMLAKTRFGQLANIYFVSRSGNLGGYDDLLIEETRFTKPIGTDYVGIYTLK